MNFTERKESHSLNRSSAVGAGVMAFFAIFALVRWQRTGELFFLLLCFRDLLCVHSYLRRSKPKEKTNFPTAAISYASAALPLFYFGSTTPHSVWLVATVQLCAIAGFLLATLAAIELGNSFGVSPAARSYCKSGVYRWFAHPMYYGYILAEGSWVILSPQNLPLFLLSVGLYIFRIKKENALVRKTYS